MLCHGDRRLSAAAPPRPVPRLHRARRHGDRGGGARAAAGRDQCLREEEVERAEPRQGRQVPEEVEADQLEPDRPAGPGRDERRQRHERCRRSPGARRHGRRLRPRQQRRDAHPASGVSAVSNPQQGIYCVSAPGAYPEPTPDGGEHGYNGASQTQGTATSGDAVNIVQGSPSATGTAQCDSIPNFCAADQYEVRTVPRSRWTANAESFGMGPENPSFSFAVL